MYEKFFGLAQDPFSIAPDPRYLFMSERHREALAHLLYGLDAGGGFVLLSGDIGTGKTTVCRCFLAQIPQRCNVAYVFNPKLTVQDLLASICEEFGVALPSANSTPAPSTDRSIKSLIDPLNAFLLKAHADGQNNVLIIDEAQNLASDVLEQLRLLTNLETNERKLLQIILIGQPELRDMLARPELEQLAQRVMARFHLDALSAAETEDYVSHRLSMAGLQGPLPFDTSAVAHVHRLSRGVPRRINLLCGRALLGAYAKNQPRVDRATLDNAAREVFGDDDARLRRTRKSHAVPRRRGGVAGAVGVLLGATMVAVTAWFIAPTLAGRPLVTASASLPTAAVVPEPSNALAEARAATPAAAAAGAVSGGTEPTASREEFFKALAASRATQNQAWRALGPLWGVNLDTPDACVTAQEKGVFCYTNRPLSLPLLRQLDRPGYLTLASARGVPVYALLTALTGDTATLTLDQSSLTVPLSLVAETWTGSFSTLWRRPDRMDGAERGLLTAASTRWLGEQLVRLNLDAADTKTDNTNVTRRDDAALRDRVNAFQIAQGLPPDGVAGPLTMMQLNRVMGLTEPRLRTSTP